MIRERRCRNWRWVKRASNSGGGIHFFSFRISTLSLQLVGGEFGGLLCHALRRIGSRRELECRNRILIRIPSGAKAQLILTRLMYGLKPVPFTKARTLHFSPCSSLQPVHFTKARTLHFRLNSSLNSELFASYQPVLFT